LKFSYDTDENYKVLNNASIVFDFPDISTGGGTLALTEDIPKIWTGTQA